MMENPPSFVVRTEAQQAAAANGFRIERGREDAWLCFRSTTARGEIWIAGASSQGPWFLAVGHPGVAAELPGSDLTVSGPGVTRYRFTSLPALYEALERCYQLGVSLPDAPLEEFRKRTAGMPSSTEVERLVVQRVGQDLFREALLEYWDSRCPLTGITDPALLRASHIVRWADCQNDAQRLDVYNGLLLSALWDAAFDAGKVSFSDEGEVLWHPSLQPHDRDALKSGATSRIHLLTARHRINLARHRSRFAVEPGGPWTG